MSRRGALVGLVALAGTAVWLVDLAPVQAEPGSRPNLGRAERALRETERAIAEERARSAELAKQAAAHRAELDRLRTEVIAVATETREMERVVVQLEANLAALFAEEMRDTAALAARAGPRAEAFGAMARLKRTPPRALMLSPSSVVDSSRTILLLSALSRSLEAEADTLNGRLARLEALRTEIAAERFRLDAANRGLAERQAGLEALVAERVALEQKAELGRSASEEQLAKLVLEAKSLEDLVAKLAAAPAADGMEASGATAASRDEAAPSDESPRAVLDEAAMEAAAEPREGAFAMPAEGRLVSHFGVTTAPGVTAKGISIETRADSPVVAPFAGKIVFAGPFHDYGQLLIIAHGQGYHTLLAGLGRIDSTVGRWVLEGEPVGVMGSIPDSRPQLYLELRYKGRPVNPVPWLATGSSKLSG